jgi:hypothetical protein
MGKNINAADNCGCLLQPAAARCQVVQQTKKPGLAAADSLWCGSSTALHVTTNPTTLSEAFMLNAVLACLTKL